MSSPPNMPPDVAELHNALWNHLIRLENQWETFEDLFFPGRIRDALVRGTANSFFMMVQKALMDALVLGLSRLLDPIEGRGGKDQNLVLERVVAAFEKHEADRAKELDLRGQLARIDALCVVARERRNKFLAHNDLGRTRIGGRSPGAPTMLIVDDLGKAIFLAEEMMDSIERHYDPDLGMRGPALRGGGDSRDLVEVLEQYHAYKKLYPSLVRNDDGEWLPSDRSSSPEG